MGAQSTKNGTHHPNNGFIPGGLLDDLAIFVAVARHGSFIAAAKHTSTPTSTVSRAVARLEERVGSPLLRRTSRKVALTEDGRQLLLRSGPHVDGLGEALAEATDQKSEPQGIIRITAPTFTGATRVTSRLAAFARKYPLITVEVDASNAIRDLVLDGYDLGIRVGPIADGDFVARKLWIGQFGLFATQSVLARLPASERRPARKKGPRVVSRTVLEREPCVVMRSSAVWRFRGRLGTTVVVKPRARFVVNDPRAAALAAQAGLGFVVLPLDVGSQADELVPLSCEDMAPEPIELYVLYPTRRLLPQRVRLAIDWLLSGA
jgi:DNA-binding transcriptional LysR family regulator